MIQIEVTKNKILQEDIEFGVGEVTQQRGGEDFVGNKVNAGDLPYDADQTLTERLNDIDAQYNYIIANVEDDPLAVPMVGLIRKDGEDLIDLNGDVFTPQVIDTAVAAEASYVKKLWVKIISGTEHHLKRGTAIIAKFNPVDGSQILSFDYNAIAAIVAASFGTAADEDVGTAAGNVVQLDGTGKLPAVDGSQLTNLPIPSNSGAPIGSPIVWLTATPPADHLLCNGAAVSRTTYASLFAVIGVSFGPGDGSTTFELPDFRGYFLRGSDNGRGIDPGRVLNTPQDDEFEAHTHTFTRDSGVAGALEATAGSRGRVNTATSSTGGTETRPKNIAVNWMIRYA